MKTAMIIQHQYQCHILGSPTFTMKGGHLDEKPRDPLCQDTLTLKTLSEERELNKPQATGCWKMPGGTVGKAKGENLGEGRKRQERG